MQKSRKLVKEPCALALADTPAAGALPIAVTVHGPPARPYVDLERFLPADRLRNLLRAYPDYRSAAPWGVFLPNAYVFTVAGPDRGDILQLLPGADDVPK